MAYRTVLSLLITLVFLAACETRQDSTPTGAADPTEQPSTFTARPILADGMEASLYEIPTEAIATWRNFRDTAPPLVLFSQSPFLVAAPKGLEQRTGDLVTHGSAADFWATSPFASADPVLFPEMAVSAALKAGWFSRLVWVLPVKEENRAGLTLASFRSKLAQLNSLSAAEIDGIDQTPEGFSGFLYGKPFAAVFPETLPMLDRPAVIHIDLSYFAPLYKNEIKTPLLPLVAQTLDSLRTAAWPTLAVTLSQSNYGERLSVRTRFLGALIARLFAEPTLLSGEIPTLWMLLRDNLYLENFFQTDTILANAHRMVEIAPEDPAAHFALYHALTLSRQGDEANAALAQAVRLDPAYALHYLDLAAQAIEKGDYYSALPSLKHARAAMPADPAIALTLVDAYRRTGQLKEAETLWRELSTWRWSAIYYPDLAANIPHTSPAPYGRQPQQ